VLPSEAKGGAIHGVMRYDLAFEADVSGDGSPEFVLPVDSGGSAGLTGVLIYADADTSRPPLAWHSGYRMTVSAANGTLQLQEPAFTRYDDECCPSGALHTRWKLTNNRLRAMGEHVAGVPGTSAAAVAEYYRLIKAHNARAAHNLLSPLLKRQYPLNAWLPGAEAIVDMHYNVTQLPDNKVRAQVSVSERTSQGVVLRQYLCVWSVVWSNGANQWLLDVETRE
jgi:hypothetical protein